MPDIVLATLNAKYIHPAFGLRYLLANLGQLQGRATLAEFDIHQRPLDIAEALLGFEPQIIGLGVYIWNATASTELAVLLKRLRPEVTLILGGPEISHETDLQPIAAVADYVITGEADLRFAEVCEQVLGGKPPVEKLIPAPPPDLGRVVLPYALYTAHDLAHRIVYVEASRGCPFGCEFCLSSLEASVRRFPLPDLLQHLDHLLARGARHFKFVDRTFNVDPRIARAILEFLLERHQPGMFFHVEIVPDLLPESLRDIIGQFPSGSLQFEAGVQTFDAEVAERIGRRQDYTVLQNNLRFLREETGAHIHADLVAGLPGESLESIATGFDRLISLGVHEIQLGLLKRLRGAPIARHEAAWQMIYSPHPPYEILQTSRIGFPMMQRLRRFARYWDLVGNSGHFLETAPLLWTSSFPVSQSPPGSTVQVKGTRPAVSPFASFLRWSDWLYARVHRTDSIALVRLMELVFEYLTSELGVQPSRVAEALWQDCQRGGHRDPPGFLRSHLASSLEPPAAVPVHLPRRQARHWRGRR
jgi:radical SAM superfamily enzyme YgiQ (UPF0313 family)